MGFEFNEDAFDEIERKLKALEGEVPLEEIFPPRFMRRYTDFGSIGEMLEESPFTIETQEDFDQLPVTDLDEFVAERTRFPSWGEMKAKAGEQYAANQLGL